MTLDTGTISDFVAPFLQDCKRREYMATVVNGTDSGNSAAMMILALVVAAVVGLGIYFFTANGGADRTPDINIEAPKMSAPSAPSMPAPSVPTPSAPSSGQ